MQGLHVLTGPYGYLVCKNVLPERRKSWLFNRQDVCGALPFPPCKSAFQRNIFSSLPRFFHPYEISGDPGEM
jgi:hypothetical protein